MASEEEEKSTEEEQEETKKQRGSILNNRLVLIGIILVVQVGIALIMAKMLSSRTTKPEQPEVEEVEDIGRGEIVLLENIVVNLRENDKLYYLKLAIGLEVADSRMKSEVEKRAPHLRDIVIATVSGKKVSELDTQEERNALKAELIRKLSGSISTGDLIQVYFSDFIVQ